MITQNCLLLFAQAKKNNCTLRYVQHIEFNPPLEMGNEHASRGSAYIKLEEVPITSLHAARGSVYHFAFHTERYSQSPLIVQGPLSDSANTASGLVGDILRIARAMGAKDRGTEHTKEYERRISLSL